MYYSWNFSQFNRQWDYYFQILHIGGQMDILCCWLNEFVIKENEERGESVITTNKIIQKHQRIINFVEYIEDMYTYIALLQFTLNTVLICSLGFLIVTVSKKMFNIVHKRMDTHNFIKSITMTFGSLWLTYILNWK